MGNTSRAIDADASECLIPRDAVEELTRVGTWRWCPETGEFEWSRNLSRIFGRDPDAVSPSAKALVMAAAPDHRARVNDELRLLADGTPRPPIDYRITTAAGQTRYVRATCTLASSADGARWLHGVVQDIGEATWAETDLDVYRALCCTLVRWESFETGAPRLVGALARALGFGLGVLWIPTDRGLVARAVWSERSATSGEATEPRLRPRVQRGEALAGRVWESGRLHWAEDVDDAPLLLLAPEKLSGRCRTVLGLPLIIADDEVIAVLTFAAREPVELGDRVLGSLSEIGLELGAFLARHRQQLQHIALSAREVQILQLSAQGLSMTEVADELRISRSTVKSHLDHIYRKLRVSGRTSAVAEMMRCGVIT